MTAASAAPSRSGSTANKTTAGQRYIFGHQI
jgi:hypothetical protein